MRQLPIVQCYIFQQLLSDLSQSITIDIKAGKMYPTINGSGFGGTMFALAPGKEEKVKLAIEEAGGEAFSITTSKGVEET